MIDAGVYHIGASQHIVGVVVVTNKRRQPLCCISGKVVTGRMFLPYQKILSRAFAAVVVDKSSGQNSNLG